MCSGPNCVLRRPVTLSQHRHQQSSRRSVTKMSDASLVRPAFRARGSGFLPHVSYPNTTCIRAGEHAERCVLVLSSSDGNYFVESSRSKNLTGATTRSRTADSYQSDVWAQSDVGFSRVDGRLREGGMPVRGFASMCVYVNGLRGVVIALADKESEIIARASRHG